MRKSTSVQAFTLIELLIVIGIIAILVSLLLVGVMPILSKAPVVQTRIEISQLDIAMQNVIQTYKLKFVPSWIKLSEQGNYPGLTPPGTPTYTAPDYNSVQFLKRMFPRLDCGKYVPDPMTGKLVYVPGSQIDWNRSGKIDADVFLQGPECLVFFLGGPGNLGFSANPANPADSVNSLQPVAFEFKQKRLIPSMVAPGYYVYVDAYATPQKVQPYVYFTSYYQGNDYVLTDCAFYNIVPYVDSTTGRYVNASSYQIISAGADWNFGPGGSVWSPLIGTTDLATKDNQANFTGGILASGQQ